MNTSFTIGESLNFGFQIPKCGGVGGGSSGSGESVMLHPIGVIEFDETAANSNFEIIKREYATGAEGFAALAKDLIDLYDWDSNTYTEGETIAEFFKDDFGLYIMQTDYYPEVWVFSTAISDRYYGGQIGSADETGSSRTTKNATIVKYNGNFSICFTDGWNRTTSYSKMCTDTIGVSSCKNLVTGEIGKCAWHLSTSTYDQSSPFVASKNTTEYASDTYDFDEYSGSFSVAIPFYSNCSTDIPDNLLMMQRYQSTEIEQCGWCTFGGKRYYKNGGILIPAE